jgi:hypothetical protein
MGPATALPKTLYDEDPDDEDPDDEDPDDEDPDTIDELTPLALHAASVKRARGLNAAVVVTFLSFCG